MSLYKSPMHDKRLRNIFDLRYLTVVNYPLKEPLRNPWISECRVLPPGRPCFWSGTSVLQLHWQSECQSCLHSFCPHDYLWLCLGSFHPCTSDWGTPVQVGWNLHVCLKTEERAAVCFLVEVFCVKTCQGYLGKCIPSKMFFYDQNHSVEQLLVNQTSSKSSIPDHQRNYELNLLCLPSSNPTYRTWIHGGKIKKEAEVLFFFWLLLSGTQSRLSCSPLLSRSRLWVGGVGVLTGWWVVEF